MLPPFAVSGFGYCIPDPDPLSNVKDRKDTKFILSLDLLTLKLYAPVLFLVKRKHFILKEIFFLYRISTEHIDEKNVTQCQNEFKRWLTALFTYTLV